MAIGDKKSAVMQSDIVNDFTTGGVTNVLSAEMGKTLAQRPNPNLLDNWYFVDPIHQREVKYIVIKGTPLYADENLSNYLGNNIESATATPVSVSDTVAKYTHTDGITYYLSKDDLHIGYLGAGYGLDRWRQLYADTYFLVKDGHITCTGTDFGQMIETKRIPLNTPLTYSVLTAEGVLGSITFQFDGTQSQTAFGPIGETKFRANFIYNWGLTYTPFFLQTEGNVINVVAMKLELGTVQTLAHQENGNWVLNEIPDYNEQLLRCCMSTADGNDTYANNKVTPAAINAVNKAGDTITGALKVSNGNIVMEGNENGSTVWFKKHDDLSNSAFITQYHGLETKNSLKFGRYQNEALLGQWDILHTLNKPSGSYTGNGDATARTIEIGGIGDVCLVWEDGWVMTLVTPAGATSFRASEGTIFHHKKEQMYFSEGILFIKTSDNQVNTNGVTYKYQVL